MDITNEIILYVWVTYCVHRVYLIDLLWFVRRY